MVSRWKAVVAKNTISSKEEKVLTENLQRNHNVWRHQRRDERRDFLTFYLS